MKRLIIRLPVFLIPIVTALFGLVIGVVLFYLVTLTEQRGTWQQLDTPPHVERLVAADQDQVNVETADSTLYTVHCRAEEPGEFCWQETEQLVDVINWPCDGVILPPAPGPVRDQIESCVKYEVIILTQYALLDDGTLWRWEYFVYPLGQVARLAQTVIISTILGAIVGIVILVGRG